MSLKQPVVIAVVIAVVVVIGYLAVSLMKGSDRNEPPPPENKDYTVEQFLVDFDENRDGSVTKEEFAAKYGTGEGQIPFSLGPGQPALGVDDAFRHWDVNSDDRVDRSDIRNLAERGWPEFAERARENHLRPIMLGERRMTLNAHQSNWMDEERAAVNLDSIPVAGAFFKAQRVGPWSEITLQNGERVTGYALAGDGSPETEAAGLVNGKLYVHFPGAKVRVYDVAKEVRSVAELPQAPQTRYLRAITGRAANCFDYEANLELARQCVADGLMWEAEKIYKRVLIFERDNAEGLKVLGLKLEGDHYVNAE